MHKHSHKPALFKAHVVLPTVKTIPILSRQQWSAKQRLRDSIDIEHCWMDGWVAFTVTVDGWFNSGPMLVWEKNAEKDSIFCVFCVPSSPCVHLCMCEREDSGRWQPLSQACRQTLSPPPTLNHLSLWHAQKCHELAASVGCVCVLVCILCLYVYALHHPPLCGNDSAVYEMMHWCVHKNDVKFALDALCIITLLFLQL